MKVLGTIVNCLTIIGGCIVGLFIKGRVNEKISTTVMNGLGLCSLYIGISGSLKCENPIEMIVSVALGALIGELIDIDNLLNKLGNLLENKFKSKDKNISISEGFVTSSLLFCVGAMAIVGSLESGLNGDNTTLYAKSVLDGVSSIIFTSTLGIGVILSVFTVLIYQGSITLLAGLLSGVLSTSVITGMSVVGNLIIIGLGLNILGMTKIKVANLLPGIFIPIIFGLF
ncbi:DUF554 domain-containing protein [Clostridium sp. DSM 8431]|uniref:DUF554 domain-containing protein n=1 Tax=Clostridium sp. DSM 8431 TaxID=1761781 RepID=UPI000B7EE8E9|nr:DUF554 domain-containing protein [Clostridium sp. DSM 8431]